MTNKKLIFAAALMASSFAGTFMPNAAIAASPICTPGQKAEAKWKGKWYPVKVLDVSGQKCFIRYEGYDSSWNEWIDSRRFRAYFRTGSSVNVRWKGKWYPARILQVSGNSYKITYDGYDSSWDEWVEPARVSRR